MIRLVLAVLLLASPAAAAQETEALRPPRGAAPAETPPSPSEPLVDRAPLESLWMRGEKAMAEGKPDEALSLFQEALLIAPDSGRTWNYLGGALFASGEYALALRRFLRAAELSPLDPKVRNNLASVYDRLGRHAEAIENYLAAIELDPAYPVPYRNLGAIYAYRLRDPHQARRFWSTFLQIAPGSPDAPGVREEMSRLPE